MGRGVDEGDESEERDLVARTLMNEYEGDPDAILAGVYERHYGDEQRWVCGVPDNEWALFAFSNQHGDDPVSDRGFMRGARRRVHDLELDEEQGRTSRVPGDGWYAGLDSVAHRGEAEAGAAGRRKRWLKWPNACVQA
jgi:hypothetical protein